MFVGRGNGELESVDHGGSRDSRCDLAGNIRGIFSAKLPRIGNVQILLEIVQDARGFLAHLPLFIYFKPTK